MIETPTVLVLGAGASVPYGFPTGAELLHLIGDTTGEGRPMRGALDAYEIPGGVIDKFRESLLRSGLLSVDTFIESRPEFAKIGKFAMAWTLIHREVPSLRYRRRDDEENGRWYHRLWERMKWPGDGPDDVVAKNNLSIITFNYDRSLEFLLQNYFAGSYGLDEIEAMQYVNQLDIVHVHGSLGELPSGDNSSFNRPFQQDVIPATVMQASESIEIVQNTDANTPAYVKARDFINNAERIVFLGFGFLGANVLRLGISRIRNCETKYATGLNLPVPYRKSTMDMLGIGELEFLNAGCLELIQNTHALL